MVDRWLRLNPQVNAALAAATALQRSIAANVPQPVPLGGHNSPTEIIDSRSPNPVPLGSSGAIIKINPDDSVEFPDDPYANGGDTYTVWQRSTHSLVLRKRYQGGDPDKYFVFVIVSEELTAKNAVFINCWQLCQMPADAIAFDVNESHRRQSSWYIDACKTRGMEPDWGEAAEEVALAAEAKDNAWDTWATDHPAPEKEEA